MLGSYHSITGDRHSEGKPLALQAGHKAASEVLYQMLQEGLAAHAHYAVPSVQLADYITAAVAKIAHITTRIKRKL